MGNYFSKNLLILFLLLNFALFGFAQNNTSSSPADSSKAIPDTLLFRIQTAQSAISEINAANKKGYNLQAFQQRIGSVQTDIAPLKTAFSAKGEQPDSKSLMSYDLILKDADVKLKSISSVPLTNPDLMLKSHQKYGAFE